MTKEVLQVSGMHCPSCKMMVEDVLGDEDAISSVKADYESGRVEVEYDDSKISLDKIKELIVEEAGYEVA